VKRRITLNTFVKDAKRRIRIEHGILRARMWRDSKRSNSNDSTCNGS
jgi:hypothetical protein